MAEKIRQAHILGSTVHPTNACSLQMRRIRIRTTHTRVKFKRENQTFQLSKALLQQQSNVPQTSDISLLVYYKALIDSSYAIIWS